MNHAHDPLVIYGGSLERNVRSSQPFDKNIRHYKFLSNDTLHLFVHHTREFASANVSADYRTDN